MCRKLVILALVLGFTSLSYGMWPADNIIGNWEGQSMESWTAAWEDAPTLSLETKGHTLGTGSMGVKFNAGGYWMLEWSAPWDPLQGKNAVPTPDQLKKLKFDLTMIRSEWTANNWTRVADKIAINSNGVSGWKEYNAPVVTNRLTGLPDSKDWGPWSYDARKRFVLDVSNYNVSGATWFQIIIAIQQNPASGNGKYYFDDVRIIPEPTTIAMLGLGSLALLRRKR